MAVTLGDAGLDFQELVLQTQPLISPLLWTVPPRTLAAIQRWLAAITP